MELSPGEHESLERERDILANLGEVQERLDAALAPLSEEPYDALSALSNAVDALESLAMTIGDVFFQPLAIFHICLAVIGKRCLGFGKTIDYGELSR